MLEAAWGGVSGAAGLAAGFGVALAAGLVSADLAGGMNFALAAAKAACLFSLKTRAFSLLRRTRSLLLGRRVSILW